MKFALPKIDRRTLLIGGGAGVGLVVAFALWPREVGSGLRARPGEGVFDHFVKIGSDGRVTVVVPQVETGQGIWTALPQILADELGAAWENVAVEPAPSAPVYVNRLAEEGWLEGVGPWREHRLTTDGALRITAGSTSIRAFERPLRQAGATARALLCEAAAERWGVAAAECDSDGGFILHEGKRLAFGELAVEASRLTPGQIAIRPVGSGKLFGQPLPRLDLPAKSDGSARFAGDVRLPGLLYASIRIAPRGGRLTGFSRAGAQSVPGLSRIVVRDGWLAVVAQTWWAAEHALLAASPKFTGPAQADSLAIRNLIEQALDGTDSKRMFERGDYAGAVAGSRPLTAHYAIAPAQHLGLETRTATARFSGDRLEVWAPTQAPEFARAAAIQTAGSAARHVTLYPMPVGDGGGRGLECEAIPIAVELARELGKPVQLTYSAKVEQNQAPLRSPLVARMAALPAERGTIAAWSARIACADGMHDALARLGGWETGSVAPSLAGAVPPYAIGHVQVDWVASPLPIACGYMRGGTQALVNFLTESFIDEMARAAGAEPLAYRMGMLGGNLRLAHAISTAAGIGGWDGGGAGSTLGLAACSAFGSHIGLLAEASIGDDQRVKVTRLVAAVDCGRIVNPGLVRQQIEGGLLAALNLATVDQPEFVAGLPIARNLRLPRIAATPAVDVELIASREAPGGVSGLGAAVLAPAVANALAAAGGRRLRNLPFAPMAAA